MAALKKLTTDDIKGKMGSIDRENPEEKRDMLRRLFLYGVLAILMAALCVTCLLRGKTLEAVFGGFFTLMLIYWTSIVLKTLLPPKVVVFCDKGEKLYHYSPDCLKDRESCRILSEESAIRRGCRLCETCRRNALEAEDAGQG